MRRTPRFGARQRRRSWYVSFFQVPWLPEALLRQRRFKALADTVGERARPDTVTAATLSRSVA